MQAVGYFFLRDDGQTFGEYFTLTRTWVTFFLHGTLFGLIIGYINWRRNEKSFAEKQNKADRESLCSNLKPLSHEADSGGTRKGKTLSPAQRARSG